VGNQPVGGKSLSHPSCVVARSLRVLLFFLASLHLCVFALKFCVFVFLSSISLISVKLPQSNPRIDEGIADVRQQ
jgi:hypothetical protein